MMQPVRAQGDGTLGPVKHRYRRKDGTLVEATYWRAAVTVDGKRVYRQAKTKAEGRALLAELLRQRDARTMDGARLTVGAYLRDWLEDVRPSLALSTWRKHESICRVHLIPEFGRHRLSDLTVAHVRKYLRRTDLDPQTLRHHRATLRRALADAQRDAYINKNVAALAKPPDLPDRERQILTMEQARRLMEGTRDDRLHALWVLLVTTGIREGEALGLTWSCVDLDNRTVSIEATLYRIARDRSDPTDKGAWRLSDPKTSKSRRVVILTPYAADALREHRRRQLEEWFADGREGEAEMVFLRPDGRFIHGSKLTAVLYPILDRLGLPRVTIHALRHSAATMYYEAGVDINTIADMLGHSTPRITAELYRHKSDKLQREAADVMQQKIVGA